MLGDDLRRARERRGLSLREAAEQGGFSKSTLSKWERGDGYPTLHHLEALAGVLQITIVVGPTETHIELE